ncbi:hypothetical protein C2W62_29360 [Candidatus Entotheonella serta]|nr:hypothetical protein C2W62_29360 [Candidatus Entotheonella serta]
MWSKLTKAVTFFLVLIALQAFVVSPSFAQKNINVVGPFTASGNLLFANQVHPDTYVLHLSDNERLRLDVNSSNFDTTLRVVGPDAAVNLFNDDGGPGLNSRLTFTARDTGYYIIVVSSFSGNPPGGNGAYTLRMERLGLTTLRTSGVAGDETGGNTSVQFGVNETEDK